MNITSAAGIISLLEEPRPELKVFALRKLDSIVDEFWPEISEAIEKIEILHEDKIFQQHHLAALVASKVYYHLGSFEDSLTYALGAGDLFDVNARTEYVETILGTVVSFLQILVIMAYFQPNVSITTPNTGSLWRTASPTPNPSTPDSRPSSIACSSVVWTTVSIVKPWDWLSRPVAWTSSNRQSHNQTTCATC
jgi:hypothetical protein